ncbi:MAG: FKBP-type peptidyl-prolyl cis-trans isomerase [Akkermansiaceae bacterium]|nr:FKBP-type peptidyl-prolyl cis-trans isomerase [Akkermansiaceae bacterium]
MSDMEQIKKVMSYIVGFHVGGQMLPQMLPGVKADDLMGEMIAKGITDALNESMDPEIMAADVQAIQREFGAMLQKRSDEKGAKNLEIGRQYMEENGKKDGVVTTESGLQYEILTPGGEEKYDAAKHGEAPTAEVMYKGTLVDGTVFDQSKQPIKFNIRQVIPGFTEALKLMPVGAKWRVTIPANLAYGANGPGSIGPNSTLIFEMELISLTK